MRVAESSSSGMGGLAEETKVEKSVRKPHPHSTGRRFRYAHGDHGFSLKLFHRD